MRWRTIDTDTESRTGVAPVCEQQSDPASDHHIRDGFMNMQDEHGVYDCCPHPHIETYTERCAAYLAELLTNADAGLCP